MKDLSKDELKVIHTIFLSRLSTRISIAEAIGISLLKTASLLSGLEKQKYIRKEGKLQSKTGRPSYVYALVLERFYTIGISVDVDSYRFIVLDSEKHIVMDRQFSMAVPSDPAEYIQYFKSEISKAVTAISGDFREQGKEIVAVCAALSGMVDSAKGKWLLGLQIGGIKNVNIAEMLGECTGIPFFIADYSRSLAFLERRMGSGMDLEDFILLYMGKGVGAGLVINGEVYAGYHGIAGEIGHIPQGNNNYRCSCGSIGCLEAIVSSSGIKRVMADRLKEGVVSSLSKYIEGKENNLNLEIIKQAAEEGDRFAIATLYELGTFIGDACATVIKLFNPQKIVISGYSSILKEFFIDAIEQKIKHSVILEMLVDYETVFADYELHNEAYGAGLLAFHRYLEDRVHMNMKVKKD
jgi:predicted NBD/HSP70 family sugar kinase